MRWHIAIVRPAAHVELLWVPLANTAKLGPLDV